MSTIQLTEADVLPTSDGEKTRPPMRPSGLAALIEMLLKDQANVDRLLRDRAAVRDLIPRLLAIGVAGYTIFGIALTFVLSIAGIWPRLNSGTSWLADAEQFPIELVSIAEQPWWHVWTNGSRFH